jgi:ABC-type glycerol-3-phosphate transport system permease component
MSQQLAVCLIAVAVNLAGMFLIFAVMAHSLACLGWRGRGIFAVIAMIVISQLFWTAPALLIVTPRDAESVSPYALWFGNWLVSGFGIVLLCQRAKSIPRSLEDSVRLDGLGAFATWRHVILPFLRRDLGLTAFFTLIATLLPFWGLINQLDTANGIVLYQRVSTPAERIGMMLACSLVGALIVIATFLITRRRSGARDFEAGY